MTEPEELIVPDVVAWRGWLDVNEGQSDGVWLVLGKKGIDGPTTLRYAEALDEALCSGWIDGQARSRDDATYVQRFTPRRARSLWSARNVEYVARLDADGRMRERGWAEVDRAKADGRWERAYPGAATAEVPEDLAAALAADPVAGERFAALTRSARWPVLFPILTASTPAVRARRVATAVAKLHS